MAVVDPMVGGCLLMRMSGPQNSFRGSTAHGVTSYFYPFWFPSSFTFQALPDGASSHCEELGWPILGTGVVWFIVFVAVLRPSRGYLWAWTLSWGFWYG